MASYTSFSNMYSTKKNFEKAKFTWEINEFAWFLSKSEDYIESPNFHSTTNAKIVWNLMLHPYGFKSKLKDYISIFLNLKEFDCVEVTAMFEFSFFIKDEKNKIKKVAHLHKYDNEHRSWDYQEFIKRDLLFSEHDEIIPNEKFTILCEVFYFCDNMNTTINSSFHDKDNYFNKLICDMNLMLESSYFSDCIIKVKDSEINVHRCILAIRSEVFYSILKDESNKSKLNVIEINDFSVEVVKEMITYIYTEKSPNMNEIALEMLAIGEKYKLDGLKFLAEKSLCYSLTAENACEYLEKSELYSADTLKQWCIRFIYIAAEKVIRSARWKEFVSQYPLLVGEIFEFCVSEINTENN